MKFDNHNEPTFYNADLVVIVPVSLASCTAENCELQQVPLKLT